MAYTYDVSRYVVKVRIDSFKHQILLSVYCTVHDDDDVNYGV